ncbi:hypothetical protein KUTeg_023530 [Tegillarca granosa]|uniref:Uncharacterized protein n=1 Tax=Tegillarca granosa TaxID=220873 RepID=A0ABQ9E7K1_TEGGR|nr:hypothetical protein KUTeg_023530 [Tegillarca granosa]
MQLYSKFYLDILKRRVLSRWGYRCGWCKRRLVLLSFAVLFVIYLAFTEMEPRFEFFNNDVNSKCIIPNPDPFDSTIIKYLNWHPQPLPCRSSSDLLHVNDTGYLVFNSTLIKKNPLSNITCTYRIVKEIDDKKIYFRDPIKFKPPVYVNGDAFSVRCFDKENKNIYENLHHKIDYENLITESHNEDETADKYSVLLFGVDSLSRLAAIRSLPKTMSYLQKSLNAYILKGYNKVHESTLDNLFSLLSGKTLEEIPKEHQGNSSAYPLIWKEYHRQGYRTLYAEDWPELHTFSTRGRRFYSRPVDHYMRPYFLGMRLLQPIPYYLSLSLTYLESKTLRFSKYSNLCYGNRPTHRIVSDYHRQFIKAYKNKLTFSFSFISQLAHDFVNFFELADEDIFEFFKSLKEGGYLENSFIFFFGDHGHRYDRIRNTVIGRIEDRMPLMSVVIPEKIKQRYPNIHFTLLNNSKKLISNFDIHETLKDILDSNFKEEKFSQTKRNGHLSLLKDIPADRTCTEASIAEEYCACYSAKKVNTNNSLISTIASFVLKSINDKLKEERTKCAKLRLSVILTAEKIVSSSQRHFGRESEEDKYNFLNFFMKPDMDNKQRYRVTFRASPGGGIFETTVLYNEDNKLINIAGNIFRTNRYGNQSHCIQNKELKPFCLCQTDKV